MERKAREVFPVIFLGVVLAYLMYLVAMNQLPSSLTDFNGHTYVYLPLFNKETWVQGWKAVPYCMWHLGVLALNHVLHIPLEASAAYVTAFFYVFAYLVMYWMIVRYTAACGEATGPVKAGAVAFGMSVAQALYFYWLDGGDRFLGCFSMNPLHNPTHMTVRPFVLLCFCLVCDIWGRQKDETYCGIFFHVERGLKRYYFYLAVILFLSSLAKPVFVEMFIPAVALLMLGEWIGRIRKKDGSASVYFKHCLRMLLCAVPTLMYVLLQFLAYFLWGGSYETDGSIIITKWMEVWSMFSDNILLSIGLGMAFPLFMILINGHFFVKNDMGRLALTGYGIGILEAALLGESGSKLSHGDFLWPMMCGMLIMWMVAILRLLTLERMQTDTKGRQFVLDLAWVLFCFHILMGLLYIRELVSI